VTHARAVADIRNDCEFQTTTSSKVAR